MAKHALNTSAPAPATASRQEVAPFDSAQLSSATGNHLLASLPPVEFRRIRRLLQPTWLLAGEVTMDSTAAPAHALFPVHAIVSLQSQLDSGAAVEFASVGNEGWLGLGLVLGDSRMPWQAVVQSGGLAYRLPASALLAEFQRGGTLAQGLLKHAGALVSQMAMLSACNRRHALEQQLCRWFLLAFDRLPGNQLAITQEIIAGILGVRREGVTEVAGRLQRAGIIAYRRGRITLLRRDRLEALACECYSIVRAEFERLRG
jgi:CRP-like cAMP-binding protein